MKRFIFKLTVFLGKVTFLLLTFVIGIASTILMSEVSPPTVTLCHIAQNPTWYNGRTVRVEADARSVYGWVVIADETCRSAEAWAGVSPVENYKPSGDVQQFFIESDSEIYKARVSVTGRFDAKASMGCFGPKFGIDATSVELKSAITTEPFKKRT